MKYAKNKSNVNMTISDIENFGKIVQVFGVPILPEEAIGLDQKKYA